MREDLPPSKKQKVSWPDDHAMRFISAGLTYPPPDRIVHPLLTERERRGNTSVFCRRI